MKTFTILLSIFIVIAFPAIAAAGSISGLVFNDLNGNGIKDAGELGIANVKILIGGSGIEASTDANGVYQFTNLAAGTYTLYATTAGWTVTLPANQTYT